jgi:hypothetical protein
MAAVPPSLQEGAPSLAVQSAVRKLVEDAGYYSVYSITPSVDGYHARAMMSGQRVTVDVDEYGNIRPVWKGH